MARKLDWKLLDDDAVWLETSLAAGRMYQSMNRHYGLDVSWRTGAQFQAKNTLTSLCVETTGNLESRSLDLTKGLTLLYQHRVTTRGVLAYFGFGILRFLSRFKLGFH